MLFKRILALYIMPVRDRICTKEREKRRINYSITEEDRQPCDYSVYVGMMVAIVFVRSFFRIPFMDTKLTLVISLCVFSACC